MTSLRSCPPTAEIVALVEGTLKPPASEAIVDHAARCPSCFRALSAARAVGRWTAEVQPFDLSSRDLERLRTLAPVAAARVGGIRRWIPYAAAAGVAVLVLAGGLQLFDRPVAVPPDGVVRGIPSGLDLVSPAPDAILPAPPERLEWKADPAEGRFRVRLLASVSEEIWRAETTESSVALPAEARERLAAGGRFLFEVGRMNGAGHPGAIDVASFEIRPPR